MAKAKAMIGKRKTAKRMKTVTGTAAKRGRRRPYEYDHQYGLGVDAPAKVSRKKR